MVALWHAALFCALVSAQILYGVAGTVQSGTGQSGCFRVSSCTGIQAAIDAGCPTIMLACRIVVVSCYNIQLQRSINIGSSCGSSSLRPVIIGSGLEVVETPMFTLSNEAASEFPITVTFSNVILSSHTVTPETFDENDLSAITREGRSAAIHSITGGVNLVLRSVDIRNMDAGAGAVHVFQPDDDTIIKGNLSVASSSFVNNIAQNYVYGGAITVRRIGRVFISASSFVSNRGTPLANSLDSASALFFVQPDSVIIERKCIFKSNYIAVGLDDVYSSTVYVSSQQVSVTDASFIGNVGDPLTVFGVDEEASLKVYKVQFTQNTGGATGGALYRQGSLCMSAVQFTANSAVGSSGTEDNGDQFDFGAGALFLEIVTGSAMGLVFKSNKITGSPELAPYWAQSLYVERGSVVFTKVTVDASDIGSAADITAGPEGSIDLCRATFIRKLRAANATTIDGVGNPFNAAAALGTVNVCPSFISGPYIAVTPEQVTSDCSTCTAAGSTDCATSPGFSWLPWLNKVYPNPWARSNPTPKATHAART